PDAICFSPHKLHGAHGTPGVLVARRALYLHHNFVCKLLNDLFGVQARAGCSCAGPFAHKLQVYKKFCHAVHEFDMIVPGDRVLVAVSGGKDSLSLLHLLRHFQQRSGVPFELVAATVDPQHPSFQPAQLETYMRRLGVRFARLELPIVALAQQKLQGSTMCSFCARLKRGLLYSHCRQLGCSKLALGQHADDLVESFFMSAFFNSQLTTMKAHYATVVPARDGLPPHALAVVRPLLYLREAQLSALARTLALPVINENCPACFNAPSERLRAKLLVNRLDTVSRAIFPSLIQR
uniref:Uncharacterized protein LOC113792331 n=1 Tax=Dermatophagoides pteronyssinus TaxID=6956 RepID=A0A6P6XY07_DERPT